MTRAQRQLHARVFYVLLPLLALLFGYALALRGHADKPAISEKSP